MPIATTDLTQRPPRSARVRLGGYAILPRMLDQEFLNFVGVDPEKLREQLAAGKSDSQIFEWIKANQTKKREAHEIEAWSCHQDRRAPGELEKREYFSGVHKEIAQGRTDIVSWFDLLDLDDYVSYGGKA